jgi:hypothetical protein
MAPHLIKTISSRATVFAGITIVIVVALAGVAALRFVGMRTTPARHDPNQAIATAPAGKLISWDIRDAKSPKSYLIDGLTLTLAQGPTQEDTGLTVVLTVKDHNGHQVKVSGDVGSGMVPAVIGVGRLDMSNTSSQVLLSTFTGGAHCCFEVKVVELFDGEWKSLDVYDGVKDLGRFPIDINGDGIPDLIFLDDRFADAFASSADSWMPPTILILRQGQLVDASNSGMYTALFSSDLTEAKAVCANRDPNRNGACAGYVADAARLGQFKSAWRFMLANYNQESDLTLPTGCRVALIQNDCPAGTEKFFETYPDALASFLATYGYITPEDARKAADASAICNGPVLGYFKLLLSSPFAVEGHCYFVPLVSVFQWIDNKTALANFGTAAPFLVDFPRPPTEMTIFRPSVVFGEGAYEYAAADGSMQTVPRVRLLGTQQVKSQDPPAASEPAGSAEP